MHAHTRAHNVVDIVTLVHVDTVPLTYLSNPNHFVPVCVLRSGVPRVRAQKIAFEIAHLALSLLKIRAARVAHELVKVHRRRAILDDLVHVSVYRLRLLLLLRFIHIIRRLFPLRLLRVAVRKRCRVFF